MIATANQLQTLVIDLETGVRGYVLSGNTESRSVNVGGEAVHMSDHARFSLYGRSLDVQTPAQRTRTPSSCM